MRFVGFALLLAALGIASCSGDSDDSGSGGTSSGGSSGSAASAGSGGLNVSGSGGSAGSDGGISGNEDECDGVDNDGNGIIDDVDVGKDGICDCLHIATLGKAGKWGQGDIFATWLDARSSFGATDLADQVLTPELLEPFQVIVVQDVSEIGRTYTTSEISALEGWVDGGGGLMTLIGYADPSERANVNALLAPHGMSYGAEQILQKQGSDTIPVTQWIAHPVTNGVSQIGVDNGYPVDGAGTVLATEQGHDVLRALETGDGRVLLWGDEWITYDSEWSGHPEYQVELFWLNAIKWLTPANQCQVPIPPSVR